MASFLLTATSSVSLIFCLLLVGCYGNQFDPHLFPKCGPFFEGWYVRLVDRAQKVSIGFLFGSVLPENSSFSGDSEKVCGARPLKDSSCVLKHCQQNPLVIASILVQDSNVSSSLQSATGTFPLDSYSIKVKGKPVTRNPDDKSPPDFSATLGINGSFVITPNQTTVNVTLGNLTLYIQASNPEPWGPCGEGPEGWLEHLPLPLHWFVYSLRSTVGLYKLTNSTSGESLAGTGASLHMEKNWGRSFPPGWVWSQGLTDSNVVLAFSGGIVDFEVLDVTAFLVGYRNPGKKLALNFTPANSIPSFVHDGCSGFVNLNVTSLEYKLSVTVFSPLQNFSSCLLGPEKDGFRSACLESYSAVATVKVYKRDVFEYVEIDHVKIRNAALELGGLYVCKNKCAG